MSGITERSRPIKTQLHIGDVKPRWVLVDGVLRNVGEFSHLSPRRRPVALCPLCNEPVILKLGAVRAHHYAHTVDNGCPASLPETALHLNVKHHLAQELRRNLPLTITQPCSGAYACKKHRLLPWITNWDDVQVEYNVDSYRPDIVLLKDGAVLGAVEVLVTHSVTAEKESYFTSSNIAWVEVEAREALYQGSEKWIAEAPLPFARLGPNSSKWICDECQRRQRELERQQQYRAQNHIRVHAAKMVDVYFPSGRKYREAFYVKKRVINGVQREAWVEREGRKRLGAPVQGNPLTQVHFDALSRQVNEYLQERVNQNGARLHTVVKWRRWQEGQKFHPADTERFPFKYEWSGTAWRKQREASPLPAFQRERLRSADVSHKVPSSKREGAGAAFNKPVGICIHCGVKTDNWWSYSGKTGTCQCRPCRDAERATSND